MSAPHAVGAAAGNGLHHLRADDLGWWLAERQVRVVASLTCYVCVSCMLCVLHVVCAILHVMCAQLRGRCCCVRLVPRLCRMPHTALCVCVISVSCHICVLYVHAPHCLAPRASRHAVGPRLHYRLLTLGLLPAWLWRLGGIASRLLALFLRVALGVRLHVCLILTGARPRQTPYMCALYVCLKCVPYMCA